MVPKPTIRTRPTITPAPVTNKDSKVSNINNWKGCAPIVLKMANSRLRWCKDINNAKSNPINAMSVTNIVMIKKAISMVLMLCHSFDKETPGIMAIRGSFAQSVMRL